ELHSFPTRRSSDLPWAAAAGAAGRIKGENMQLTGYRVGFIAFWSLCMLLPGCSPPPGDAVQQATSADADIRAPRMELQSLFDDEWAARLVRDPLFASSMGIHRYNDRLPDESG